MRGRVLVLMAVLCVAALALPLGAASAAAPAAKATGPIVKVGVMLPIQATIANPDAGDAFKTLRGSGPAAQVFDLQHVLAEAGRIRRIREQLVVVADFERT